MHKNFKNLILILVEPVGPLNIGSVARLCANFEVNDLRIVSPGCDIFSIESRKMALKGKRYLDQCRIYNNTNDAIFDCDLVLATCGRNDVRDDFLLDSPENISNWISSFSNINNLAILFGREDRGLSNSEMLLCQKIFHIKTSKNYPSLNLSHAVSIILYELSKSTPNNARKDVKVFDLASSKEINDSFSELEEMLIRVGYLLKHTSHAKIAKFKKYILKAKTSSSEINILRGIVHQINWFLNNSKGK